MAGAPSGNCESTLRSGRNEGPGYQRYFRVRCRRRNGHEGEHRYTSYKNAFIAWDDNLRVVGAGDYYAEPPWPPVGSRGQS